jgi:hypothetical protein
MPQPEPAMAAAAPAAAASVRSTPYTEAVPFSRPAQRPIARSQLTDLDIPTFIRRQMD